MAETTSPWTRSVFSVVIIALGIVALVATFSIRTTKVDDAFGPRLMPQALAVLIIAGGLVTLVQQALAWRESRGRGADGLTSVLPGLEHNPQAPAQPAHIGFLPVSFVIVTFIIVYVYLIETIGFHTSTVVFSVAGLLICGVRKISILVLFPVGTVLFLYLVFERLLEVRFP